MPRRDLCQQPVEVVLADPGLREIRQGEALFPRRRGRDPVRDQRGERAEGSLRQGLDRAPAVEVLAVGPGEAQAAIPDRAIDLDQMAAALPRAACRARVLGGEREDCTGR